MTTINSLSRQPTAQDYASPTQFKFSIIKLPKVEYFCTAVNIPGIQLGSTEQPTSLKDIPIPGDKLTYDTLSMTFMVDENLENYQEIHGWLVGLGFPRDYSEFRSLATSGDDRFPGTSNTVSTEPGKVKYGANNSGGTFSDATLSILTSKNNPILEVRFRDIYPTVLSGLNYDQQAGDVDYLTASVTFNYNIYDFASVGSSSTSVTTS
jgi:hypothetical protein